MNGSQVFAEVSSRRTGATGSADSGCSNGTLGASCDRIACDTAGATRNTGVIHLQKSRLANTSDIVRGKSPISSLVTLLANVDASVGNDGALNTLWVDIRAFLVNTEPINSLVRVVYVLDGLITDTAGADFGPFC